MQLNFLRLGMGLLVLSICLALLIYGSNFLIPIAVSVLLWSLLDAIRNYYFKHLFLGRFPHALCTTLAIATVAVFIYIVYAIVVSQSDSLERTAPIYQENFRTLISKLSDAVPTIDHMDLETLTQDIDIGAVLSYIASSAGSLFKNIGLVAIYLGFMLAEQPLIARKLHKLQQNHSGAGELPRLTQHIAATIKRYMWMKTVISLLTALISYAVLALVGVDFAEVWALLIFLLNFIPNIGSIIGVIFPALLTLIQFDSFTPFFIVSIGLGCTQFFIGNVIEPAYMGKSLNLSSLMIILSLTFWGTIWGIAGMFLAVPLMVVSAIVFASFKNTRWIAILLSADGELIEPAKHVADDNKASVSLSKL
ncbi:AI-2E family transporter [Agaribacterium haliotis]|uniref:AI-2E family transporter n=1 Tax=Agaribacterium haliotis TaxID=2013869 RepID=UPI000BB59481|nr:AI-2E family transporter [Agaribacterium haliotis]